MDGEFGVSNLGVTRQPGEFVGRVLKLGIGVVAGLIALACVTLVCLAVYEWRPLIPFGKGIGNLSLRDQVLYLTLEDQLKTNEALDSKRATESEIAIAGDYNWCSKDSSMGRKLASLSAGKLKVRVDCSEKAKEFIAAYDDPGGIQAGYVCGGLCGNGNFYIALSLRGIPIVIRSIGYVN